MLTKKIITITKTHRKIPYHYPISLYIKLSPAVAHEDRGFPRKFLDKRQVGEAAAAAELGRGLDEKLHHLRNKGR
jgi:hypothetical protein